MQVAALQLVLPAEVLQSCDLPLLEDEADLGALEVAYMRRGQALVECDAKRALLIEILNKERRLRSYTRG